MQVTIFKKILYKNILRKILKYKIRFAFWKLLKQWSSIIKECLYQGSNLTDEVRTRGGVLEDVLDDTF